MLTYSVDDKISFRDLKMWQDEFLYYADVKESAQFPFIVVGNKVSILNVIILHFVMCFSIGTHGSVNLHFCTVSRGTIVTDRSSFR